MSTCAFDTKVAGVTFDGRQAVVASVPRCQAMTLVHEPTNANDPNAVCVLCLFGSQWYQIGFLPRDLAPSIASMLDQGAVPTITHWHVSGGVGEALGVHIWVRMAGV